MLALSIRQPWAWLILHGGKDIENRNWPTKVRGRVLMHAAKGCTRAEYEDAGIFTILSDPRNVPAVPQLAQLQRGGIVGSVEIVDCVRTSDSRWFVGEYGFVLRDPRPLPFTPFKGSLGFFNVPREALAEPPSAPRTCADPWASWPGAAAP